VTFVGWLVPVRLLTFNSSVELLHGSGDDGKLHCIVAVVDNDEQTIENKTDRDESSQVRSGQVRSGQVTGADKLPYRRF